MWTLNQTAMNVWYALFANSANVLITSILHQLSIPRLRIPEKNLNKQNEVIAISINKIWTWTVGVT